MQRPTGAQMMMNQNVSPARLARNQMEQNNNFQMNYNQTSQPNGEEIDIEKELEAKFDELFGSDNY